MIKVIIFGGTTEGRELAGFCGEQRIPALVCVASEYGQQVLPEYPSLNIHTGKLDEAGMIRLMEEHHPALVIDATHPYASLVTANIKKSCVALSIMYQRVSRAANRVPGEQAPGVQEQVMQDQVIQEQQYMTVPDIEAAVTFIENTTGNIFLTTGSKQLDAWMQITDSKERIFARVLPDSKVLAACEQLGLKGRHLIGMQGPFSQQLNQAMLIETDAAWMVTKESGAVGGFIEKIQAAEACGVSILVIGRPSTEAGLSVMEAKQMLQQYINITQEEVRS